MKPYFFLSLLVVLSGCVHRNRQTAASSDDTSTPVVSSLLSAEASSRDGRSPNEDQLAAMLPARRPSLPEQRLRRMAYVCSFNNQTLMPNWVAWQLTKAHTQGRLSRDKVKFMEDQDVAPQYRVTTFDYNRSGYDRGHMCPAGDNKWNATALQQCFLMTNICPQGHNLNAGDWNDLEIRCRQWARQYGDIYIVCGPILRGNAQRRIGRRPRRITVPDAFFKVVVCLNGTPKGIGFIYENEDGHHPMDYYVRTIDEVERVTGYDFLAGLPDATERAIEGRADLRAWGRAQEKR